MKEKIRQERDGWVGEEARLSDVCGGCCDVKKNRGVHSEGKRTARKDGSVTFPSDKAILPPHDPVSAEQIGKR